MPKEDSHSEFAKRLKLFANSVRKSQKELADIANVTRQSVSGYMTKSLPQAAVLSAWSKELNLNVNWLLLGEGEMFKSPPSSSTDPALKTPFPMIGLASCGVMGMEQIMPFAITTTLPHFGNKSFAVVASGESMVPAGIASGHVCYCDPEQKALAGEAVFLKQNNNLGAIKLFLGPGEKMGTQLFKGWLPPDEEGKRKEFIMEVSERIIECVAPVVLVRRRM